MPITVKKFLERLDCISGEIQFYYKDICLCSTDDTKAPETIENAFVDFWSIENEGNLAITVRF